MCFLPVAFHESLLSPESEQALTAQILNQLRGYDLMFSIEPDSALLPAFPLLRLSVFVLAPNSCASAAALQAQTLAQPAFT